ELKGDAGFRELLGQVRHTVLEAHAHQDVPFEKLVEELQPERDKGRSPLVQALFVFQNINDQIIELPGLRLAEIPGEQYGQPAKFELTVSLREHQGALEGTIEFDTGLFARETITALAGRFVRVLEQIAQNPGRQVYEIAILEPAERRELLVRADQAAIDRPRVCLHELFELQAARTPEAPAVKYKARQLTYAQLNRRTNQLAHYLRKQGVGPESLVGVCMTRSLDMVVALLGILKAGGAYVPLDPEYPPGRLAYMIKDSGVSFLLTQEALTGSLPAAGSPILSLDFDWETVAEEPAGPCASGCLPENPAYVIYTSGSTGRAKGVVNVHSGICNRLLWMQEAYGLSAVDSVLQKASFSFDVSVWEFFWPLITGACLVMAQPGGHKDAGYLANIIQQESITTLHFVPSMLSAFLEEPSAAACHSLRWVISSGETLPKAAMERFYRAFPEAELHNLYGPTEASVDVTFWRCQPKDAGATVPIGRPISNTQMYVLDDGLEPVCGGAAGQLYIAGTGLARGYLRRPDLTAKSFLPNPFSTGPGERLYRTGDMARWRPDGNLEFLGRGDHQVKIRGYRIELGEIEAVLLEQSGVEQAVVVVRQDQSGGQRLVAYVAAKNTAPLQNADLGAAMKQRLPDYMVPAGLVIVQGALPLTLNGKIDRKALPEPSTERRWVQTEYVAPRLPLEGLLTQLWVETLRVDRVGLDDNFFALGGHSLLATQLVARIGSVLHLDMPVRKLFDAPTVRELAKVVSQLKETASANRRPAFAKAPREEELPLSYGQQRLWFLDQFEPGSSSYNMPFGLRLSGGLNEEALRWSL
ncbi:MAG: amino acid adenylation domain-containing protein, partial [Candidatus Angelobacter sp.]